ncbi:MAG: NAD(P)-dependent oxidoreductase [Bacteroidales bacterium]|nr:NAD(P)-dependent oxidoreductase [Bacteroidales bacterium]
MSKKRIVITGGSGFIGSHVASYFSFKPGIEVVLLIRESSHLSYFEQASSKVYRVDFDDYETLKELFIRLKPEGVIHIAGSTLTSESHQANATLINTNIVCSINILEAAVKAGCQAFITTGSISQHYENKKYAPVNFYASTKQAFDDLLNYYASAKLIRCVSLHLSDSYGERDKREKILNHLIKIARSGESLGISPGDQFLDLVHIDDIAHAYWRAWCRCFEEDAETLEVFRVSSDESITLKSLVKKVERITGVSLNVNFGEKEYRNRELFIPWKVTPILPGWNPKVALDEGIERVFKFCKSHS